MSTRRKKKSGIVLDGGGIYKTFHDIEPGIAWGNVIRDTLRVDNPSALASHLRSELILSVEELTSYSAVLRALNRSAKNYDDSYLLYRVAKIEDMRFAIDVRERLEVMRTVALQELMDEYKKKSRKSPTLSDIEDRMIVNWSDEYRHIQHRQNELHGAVKSLEALSKAWSFRCADLRVMADVVSRRKKG